MYWQSLAKSKAESVSLLSPSQSVNLLTKCASYRRFAHASRRLRQTDRDERRICGVNANFSSGWKTLGQLENRHSKLIREFVNVQILARTNASVVSPTAHYS